jgi:hypothetical protein
MGATHYKLLFPVMNNVTFIAGEIKDPKNTPQFVLGTTHCSLCVG